MNIKSNHFRFGLFLAAAIAIAALLASCSSEVTQPATSGVTATEDLGKAVTRSFDEWLAAQGTFCWPDGEGGCFIFNDPVPNYTVWYNPDTWYALWPDYAGLGAAWIYSETGGSIDIGTNISGKVTERVRQDGSVLVHVTLRATDALIWGLNWDTWDLLFGYSPQAVVYDGMDPALGTVSLNLKFVMPEPGMPMPDLIEVSFFPEENMYVEFLGLKCKAEGVLHEATGYPEGTWGRAWATQINTAVPQPHNNINWDAWPVENIFIGK